MFSGAKEQMIEFIAGSLSSGFPEFETTAVNLLKYSSAEYSIIVGIINALSPIAFSLIFIYFFVDLIEKSVSIGMEMTTQMIIKALAGIMLADMILLNTHTIVQYAMEGSGAFIDLVSGVGQAGQALYDATAETDSIYNRLTAEDNSSDEEAGQGNSSENAEDDNEDNEAELRKKAKKLDSEASIRQEKIQKAFKQASQDIFGIMDAVYNEKYQVISSSLTVNTGEAGEEDLTAALSQGDGTGRKLASAKMTWIEALGGSQYRSDLQLIDGNPTYKGVSIKDIALYASGKAGVEYYKYKRDNTYKVDSVYKTQIANIIEDVAWTYINNPNSSYYVNSSDIEKDTAFCKIAGQEGRKYKGIKPYITNNVSFSGGFGYLVMFRPPYYGLPAHYKDGSLIVGTEEVTDWGVPIEYYDSARRTAVASYLKTDKQTQEAVQKAIEAKDPVNVLKASLQKSSMLSLVGAMISAHIARFLSAIASFGLTFVCLSTKLEILLRMAFAPVALSGFASDSRRQQASTYLRKMFACMLYAAGIIILVKLGAALAIGGSLKGIISEDTSNNVYAIGISIATSAGQTVIIPFAIIGAISAMKSVINEALGT